MSKKVATQILQELVELRREKAFNDVIAKASNCGIPFSEEPEIGLQLSFAYLAEFRNVEGVQLTSELTSIEQAKINAALWLRLNLHHSIFLARVGQIAGAQTALDVCHRGGEIEDETINAEVDNMQGILNNMRGDWLGGIAQFRRALSQYQQLGKGRGVAAANHNLGVAYCYCGAFDEAECSFLEATHYYASEGTRQDNVLTDSERAVAVLGLGDLKRAALLSQRAVEACSAASVNSLLGDVLRIWGLILTHSRRFEEARAAFATAIGAAEANQNRHLLGEIEEARGETELALENYTAAAEHFREAANNYIAVGATGFFNRVTAKLDSLTSGFNS